MKAPRTQSFGTLDVAQTEWLKASFTSNCSREKQRDNNILLYK